MDDNNFLRDFDIADPPVFAKKSAPPAPAEDPSDPAGKVDDPPHSEATFPTFPATACSTPNSSILNSSNDNSRNYSRPEEEESMETDPPIQGKENQDLNTTNKGGSDMPKKSRNRSRAKKAAAKNTPEIALMLANLTPDANVNVNSGTKLPLNDQRDPSDTKKKRKPKFGDRTDEPPSSRDQPHHPTVPPLPEQEPPSSRPLPPPPPPSATEQNAASEDTVSGNDSKKKGEKDKKPKKTQEKTVPKSSGAGAQRTSARIPKFNKEHVSHNRQWVNPETHINDDLPMERGNDILTSGKEASAGRPQQVTSTIKPSAYDKKPGGNKDVCLDVTSHRFLPEDDIRVAIVLRKMIGDSEPTSSTQRNLPTNEIIVHDFPTICSKDITGVDLEDAPGAAQLYTADDSRFVTIAELATVERPDVTIFHTLSRRDTMTFILVYRPESARGKKSWEIPPLTLCQDFINDLLCKLYEADLGAVSAYARSGKWGRIQTIVLHTSDLQTMAEFRRQLALLAYKGFSFDSFPRDAVIAKADITILLRASMKAFKTEMIPRVLFQRNQDCVAGTLRVMSTRFFPADSVSHKGESKEHWRSIELKGNEQFMRCLRFIPESKPFLLGYDTVQIRGGLRPQENSLPIAGNKRPWSEYQPADRPLLIDPRRRQFQSQQQQHQQYQLQQQRAPDDLHEANASFNAASDRGASLPKRGRPFRGRGRGRYPRKP